MFDFLKKLKKQTIQVAETTKEDKERIEHILKAFRAGKEFVLNGPLCFVGACSLSEGFHKVPEYDGFVCEADPVLSAFGDTEGIKKAHKAAINSKKPVLFLNNGLIYEVTPKMKWDDLNKKIEMLVEKKQAFKEGEDTAKKVEKERADAEYKKLTIVNRSLWDKLIEENRRAPQTDFVPHNFSEDSNIRIEKLMLYGRVLEGLREKDGLITPSAVERADDLAGLSFDLQKMTRNSDHLPGMRFEGMRFWADVVLARTWKYGDELLKAEGFDKEAIEGIKTHPKLPTKYTYWEALSHPFMQDLRVKEFWYGEKIKRETPQKITAHHSKIISPSKENQNG